MRKRLRLNAPLGLLYAHQGKTLIVSGGDIPRQISQLIPRTPGHVDKQIKGFLPIHAFTLTLVWGIDSICKLHEKVTCHSNDIVIDRPHGIRTHDMHLSGSYAHTRAVYGQLPISRCVMWGGLVQIGRFDPESIETQCVRTWHTLRIPTRKWPPHPRTPPPLSKYHKTWDIELKGVNTA